MSKASVVSLNKKTDERTVLKNSLLQPYVAHWPLLEKGVIPFILSELNRLLEAHPEAKKVKSAGKRKSKGNLVKSENKENLRSGLLVGIREVTKALEKNQVSLLLVCRSAKPAFLTQHLIQLVATRSVPAACISDLSISISSHLGLKSVLALGFRKETKLVEISRVADDISRRLKPITLPWIQNPIGQAPQHCGEETATAENHSDDFVAKELVATKVCVNKSVSCGKRKRKR